MRTSLVVLTIGLAVGLAGCESKIGRGAAIGGAGGAAVGAVVPGLSTVEGAAIGAAGGAIGRASCRERVCQYVSISVVAVSLDTHTTKNNTTAKTYLQRSTLLDQ